MGKVWKWIKKNKDRILSVIGKIIKVFAKKKRDEGAGVDSEPVS